MEVPASSVGEKRKRSKDDDSEGGDEDDDIDLDIMVAKVHIGLCWFFGLGCFSFFFSWLPRATFRRTIGRSLV